MRRSVEAITAEVIDAIACLRERTIEDDAPPHTLEALIEIFVLGRDSAAVQQRPTTVFRNQSAGATAGVNLDAPASGDQNDGATLGRLRLSTAG